MMLKRPLTGSSHGYGYDGKWAKADVEPERVSLPELVRWASGCPVFEWIAIVVAPLRRRPILDLCTAAACFFPAYCCPSLRAWLGHIGDFTP